MLVHHTKGTYEEVADEMDALLQLHRTGFVSVRNHLGRFSAVRREGEVHVSA